MDCERYITSEVDLLSGKKRRKRMREHFDHILF